MPPPLRKFSKKTSSLGNPVTPYWDGVNSVSVSLDRYRALVDLELLSSPRAESARAVTGRRCPHSGTGQDFLARNGPNRTKTAVTRQRSERFGRAQRLNGANAEGYKRPVDKNRGPISKHRKNCESALWAKSALFKVSFY